MSKLIRRAIAVVVVAGSLFGGTVATVVLPATAAHAGTNDDAI